VPWIWVLLIWLFLLDFFAVHESGHGPPTAAPAAERRGGFQGYFRRASGEVPRQSLTDTVEKVDFFKWTKFSRGAGAFVRKLYGGTHEQSHFQPAGFVTSLQGIRVATAGFDGSAARFYRHFLF
jgi:hypothetical protein